MRTYRSDQRRIRCTCRRELYSLRKFIPSICRKSQLLESFHERRRLGAMSHQVIVHCINRNSRSILRWRGAPAYVRADDRRVAQRIECLAFVVGKLCAEIGKTRVDPCNRSRSACIDERKPDYRSREHQVRRFNRHPMHEKILTQQVVRLENAVACAL